MGPKEPIPEREDRSEIRVEQPPLSTMVTTMARGGDEDAADGPLDLRGKVEIAVLAEIHEREGPSGSGQLESSGIERSENRTRQIRHEIDVRGMIHVDFEIRPALEIADEDVIGISLVRPEIGPEPIGTDL